MCVTSEEPDAPAGYPGVTAYAPRITGINTDMLSAIDWSEAFKLGAIGAAAGAATSGLGGAMAGGAGGALAAMESQNGVNLDEILEMTYDLPIIPGYPMPNVPLY